jgi:hypothetical protein
VDRAHAFLADHVQPGTWAVDATAGNGHDTAFLASRVGTGGRVLALDLQAEALASASLRLLQLGLRERCELVHGSHCQLLKHLPEAAIGQVSAVVFNLGYLPGGNKCLVTRPESTLSCLDACLVCCQRGAALSILAYRGHPGGMEESEAVEAWIQRRQKDFARVERAEGLSSDPGKASPVLWLISLL